MKYIFYILLSVLGLHASAQKKTLAERQVQANAALLEKTVFGTKDSLTLEKLFAKQVHYEHSHGQVQTREQAIHGIVTNKSAYVISTDPAPYTVDTMGDSIFVNKPFKAIEKKANGTESPLDFTVTTVWFKEGGEWKMSRRKATIIYKQPAAN